MKDEVNMNPADVTTTAVLAAQKRFDQAELHAERDELERLLTDDFFSIGPKGFVLDKHQWITRHDNFTYHELHTSDVDVRAYRDAAIVRNIQRNKAQYGADKMEITVRVSQVWIRQSDDWKLAGIQFSPLDLPPGDAT